MGDKKEVIFSVTAKDFRWTYFNGTGGGGQHRNKHANCVRLFHDPSGASAVAQDQRDKQSNERKAFERIANTPEFQKWLKIETARRLGDHAVIEEKVKKQLGEVRVESKNEKGKWEENKELKITHYDILNAFEED